jgi:hypothetical protein
MRVLSCYALLTYYSYNFFLSISDEKALHARRDEPHSRSHTPCNTASGQVVGGEHDSHFVARDNAYKIHTNAPREDRKDLVLLIYLNLKHGIREGFEYFPLYLNLVLFGHGILSDRVISLIVKTAAVDTAAANCEL